MHTYHRVRANLCPNLIIHICRTAYRNDPTNPRGPVRGGGRKKISTQRENAGITINISGCELSAHLPRVLLSLSSPAAKLLARLRKHRRSIVLVRAFLEIRDFRYSRNQLAFGGKNFFDFSKFRAEKWKRGISISIPLVISLDLSRLTFSQRSCSVCSNSSTFNVLRW